MTFLAVFLVAEVALFHTLEEHYWIIPVFISFNVLVTFILTRYLVVRAFVFSFGQKWLVDREIRDLNGKYCTQYEKHFKSLKKAIETLMVKKEYQEVEHDQYKQGKDAFRRIADFVEKFSVANRALITDHDEKVKAKKKTRRF